MIAARLEDEFSRRLAEGGLDLVKRFAAADVNPHLDGLSLETFDRPRALGFVVGNTRALWPHLIAGMDRQTAHPVDDYCARLVEEAARATGIAHQSYGSPVMIPRPLPMQRIAALAGLADLSPSHLSVHPDHGPWIALRAVVMFDADVPVGRASRYGAAQLAYHYSKERKYLAER